MEKCGKVRGTGRLFSGSRMPAIAMRSCSACAGDYEDPGRTAGHEEADGEGAADEYEVEWEDQPEGELESVFERDDAQSPATETDARDDNLAD